MKWVIITQDTKTEAGAFYQGEHRNLDIAIADDLVSKGWAVPKSVTLEVQSLDLRTSAKSVGK